MKEHLRQDTEDFRKQLTDTLKWMPHQNHTDMFKNVWDTLNPILANVMHKNHPGNNSQTNKADKE